MMDTISFNDSSFNLYNHLVYEIFIRTNKVLEGIKLFLGVAGVILIFVLTLPLILIFYVFLVWLVAMVQKIALKPITVSSDNRKDQMEHHRKLSAVLDDISESKLRFTEPKFLIEKLFVTQFKKYDRAMQVRESNLRHAIYPGKWPEDIEWSEITSKKDSLANFQEGWNDPDMDVYDERYHHE